MNHQACAAVRQVATIAADAALLAVKAAVQHGRERGVSVVAAVTGRDGELLALWRDEDAFAPSISIAADKAYTAAAFMASTDDLAQTLSVNPLLTQGIGARPRVILFGGGVPLRQGTDIVGAIGVSGGSEDDDRACAAAGSVAFAAAQKGEDE